MKSCLVTVFTPTLNCSKHISNLISSLENQSNKNFKWLIKDGGSTDNTLEIIKQSKLNLKIICKPDHSLFEALNTGIDYIETPIYIFMGADDTLRKDAIENFYDVYDPDVKMYFFAYKYGNKTFYPKKNLGFLYGQRGCASSHAVGTYIDVSLHINFGKFDENYSICADGLFIKRVVYSKKVKLFYSNKLNGSFNPGGYSSKNTIKYLNEFFEIQLLTEKYKFFQIIIYFLRIIKHYFAKKI